MTRWFWKKGSEKIVFEFLGVWCVTQGLPNKEDGYTRRNSVLEKLEK